MKDLHRGKIAAPFAGAVTLQTRATWLANLHPRGKDYIEQAPVIVAASLAYRVEDTGKIWLEMCARGAKLGEMLDILRINRGLRGADPKSFQVGTFAVLTQLAQANTSAIARQVATRTVEQQKAFWKTLTEVMANGMGGKLVWMAEHMPPTMPFDITHLRDYLHTREGGAFSVKWKWRDLLAGIKHWEESFAKAKRLEEERYNAPLSPHKDAVKTWETDGVKFVLLSSVNDLREEGAVMHHCVGTHGYDQVIARGDALIYGARIGDKRVGTLELRKVDSYQEPIWEDRLEAVGSNMLAVENDDEPYEIKTRTVRKEVGIKTINIWQQQQFKAHHNSAPSTQALRAAVAFIRANFQTDRPTRQGAAGGRAVGNITTVQFADLLGYIRARNSGTDTARMAEAMMMSLRPGETRHRIERMDYDATYQITFAGMILRIHTATMREWAARRNVIRDLA